MLTVDYHQLGTARMQRHEYEARSYQGDSDVPELASKSASFGQDRPGDGTPKPLNIPASTTQHDKHVRMVDLNTGEPLANQRYRVQMEDGQVLEGVTDAHGLTPIFQSSLPYGDYTIKAIHD